MSEQSISKAKSEADISTEIQAVLHTSERSICLPYELTIIEVDSILSAIRRVAASSNMIVELWKGREKKSISAPSAFDICEFIFTSVYELPTATCRLVHEPTKSTVIWDDDERFVVIAGSKAFCESAFPHTFEVLEHFYVQSSINVFEEEKKLRERFASLTSDEFRMLNRPGFPRGMLV
jgi:hypothetical protein